MQYEDDDYHPNSTALNYDDDLGTLGDDNDSEMRMYNEQYGPDDAHSETITVDSKKRKYRKMWDDAKKVDTGFHKLKRRVGLKMVEIEVYTSSVTPGRMIRDAITGTRYNQYRVGSINEHLFFKVGISTGEIGQNGGTLFFDSPEQYERHMKCTLSQAIKEKWMKKCAEVRNIAYDQDEQFSDYVVVK
jgi:hypothetical protein